MDHPFVYNWLPRGVTVMGTAFPDRLCLARPKSHCPWVAEGGEAVENTVLKVEGSL